MCTCQCLSTLQNKIFFKFIHLKYLDISASDDVWKKLSRKNEVVIHKSEFERSKNINQIRVSATYKC